MLTNIKALIMDFDGVFTDNKVYVDMDGRESVRCDRGDGMGIARLKKLGYIKLIVISSEVNAVVAARCEKLKLDYVHGVEKKHPLMLKWLSEAGIPLSQAAYIGNDVNDMQCMQAVGLAIAPADACEEILEICDIKLTRNGGDGAIRQLCEMIISARGANSSRPGDGE